MLVKVGNYYETACVVSESMVVVAILFGDYQVVLDDSILNQAEYGYVLVFFGE